VLVGLLASYHSIVHPGFLLLVLGLYREAVEDEDLPTGIAALTALQLESFAAKDRKRVRVAMLEGLEGEEWPNSLHPFVPHGHRYHYSPDADAVGNWRRAAITALPK